MATGALQHARLRNLTIREGELLIGGEPVSRLAERAGGTPFFAYDRAAITQRIAKLRAALPPRVQLHYAVKANPMPAVVGHIANLVDGFDVASQCEMNLALNAGMAASDISFAGPGKRIPELRAALAAGICLHCESELEITRVSELSHTMALPARVAIRVNPDFELKGAGMKMSGSPKQFGIDAARVPTVIAEARARGLEIEGLHIFCGSQNLNSDAIIDANRKSLDLAERFCQTSGVEFRTLNIGGGYGIPYFPGEEPLDLEAVGSALADSLAAHTAMLARTAIVVELGRYIVGEAGYYVCRIIDLKESQGHLFAIADGGLHHHLANSGNFGQILRKNYPVVIANRITSAMHGPGSIVGPLCTPLDLLADRIEMPTLQLGDFVAVLQSGAYGYSASPHGFLSHPAAIEIVV